MREMKVEAGDVVFAKKVWKLGPDTQLEFAAKKNTYFVSLALGLLRDRKDLPTRNDYFLLLGSIGLVGTDDIGEALGDDAVKKVLAHVEQKYKVQPVAENPKQETETE